MTEEDFHRELEIDVLARTIWGEARGEGREGMGAVACMVLNRVRIAEEKGGSWWGNSVIQVCQKPYQFSCWNKDDANFRKVLAADGNDANFAMPDWAAREKPVAVIGRHIFYRMEI